MGGGVGPEFRKTCLYITCMLPYRIMIIRITSVTLSVLSLSNVYLFQSVFAGSSRGLHQDYVILEHSTEENNTINIPSSTLVSPPSLKTKSVLPIHGAGSNQQQGNLPLIILEPSAIEDKIE